MNDIYKTLKDLKIKFVQHDHPPLYTCEQAEKYYVDIKGGKSKNLFLRNGNKHYLVVVESHKSVDLKSLAKSLDEKNLSFASPERLEKRLGLTPGAVSPFGLINDKKKEVVVIADSGLFEHKKLHFHPNINTATLQISSEDFKKFLSWTSNNIKFIKF